MADVESASLLGKSSIGGTFEQSKPVSYTWAGELEGDDAPEKTGDIMSSAMNLAACALGSSMLSLSYTMMVAGPLTSFGLLLGFAVMSYYAAESIVQAGIKCQKSTYAQIVTFYFGAGVGRFCEVLLSCALALAAISYIVGLRDLMPNLVSQFDSIPPALRVIGVLLVLYPVTLISDLSAFGSASTLAAIGCYIQAGALVYQVITGDSSPAPQNYPSIFQNLVRVDLAGVFYALPMICFVYAFHYVLTDTLSEVSDPTEERLSKVSVNTIVILVGCYIPVSVSGYLMVSGHCTDNNLLNCLPTSAPAVSIANWSIGSLLFITYSLFIIPLRRKLETVVYGEQTTAYADPRRLTIAASIMAFIAAVSIALKDLGLASTLAGGCISIVMFVFPGALMFFRDYDLPMNQRNRKQLITGAFFMATGLTICFSGFFGNALVKEENLGEIPYVLNAAVESTGR